MSKRRKTSRKTTVSTKNAMLTAVMYKRPLKSTLAVYYQLPTSRAKRIKGEVRKAWKAGRKARGISMRVRAGAVASLLRKK